MHFGPQYCVIELRDAVLRKFITGCRIAGIDYRS